jgi:hypothetical protein
MSLALGVRLRSYEALWPLSGLHSIRGECLIDRVQYRCEDDVLAIVTANADALDVDYVRRMLTLLEGALAQRDLLSAFEQAVSRARRGP